MKFVVMPSNMRGTGIFLLRNGKWTIAGVHVGPNRLGEPIGTEARK